MKVKPEFRNQRGDRRGECGAALVSTLLVSALLLTAGGMLILTTSMTGTNTVASANETQAYYGAEAGLQAALNVLRGNVLPNPLFVSNPIDPQNKISFSKAVNNSTSNLATDPTVAFPARLSRWLPYNYTPTGSTYADRVAISQNYSPLNGIAYSVVITDPDNTVLPSAPSRLLIQSTGYGPRGARKLLSMLVSAYGLDVQLPAMITIRGHDDHATNAYIEIGNSAVKNYSGADLSGVEPTKPTFAVSNHDVPVVQATYASKPNTVSDPKYGVLDLADEPAPPGLGVPVPWFMRTATDARTFLAQAKALAQKRGVVLSSLNGDAGSAAAPQFTFVDGDAVLGNGAGLLIVTGTLTLKGGQQFNGVILVLGGGTITAGGNDHIVFGAIGLARFNATGGFLDPVFNLKTGRPKVMSYDSNSYLNGMGTTRIQPVQGIVEQ